MKTLKEMTDSELRIDAIAMHDAIFVSDCFGTKDLVRYEMLLAELESRGWEIGEHRVLEFHKDNDNGQ